MEKNLVNLVAEIREALGDDATHPRFIRTVHRFGYAFREAAAARGRCARELAAAQVCFRLNWVNGRARSARASTCSAAIPTPDLPGLARSVEAACVIRISADQATIEDLGSKNGTFVGDERVDGAQNR